MTRTAPRVQGHHRLGDQPSTQPVTAPQGHAADNANDDKDDGDDDPLDPREGNGSVQLVAVRAEVVAARETAAESGSERRGAGEPEDPATLSVRFHTFVHPYGLSPVGQPDP